jgi:hypothetical protein
MSNRLHRATARKSRRLRSVIVFDWDCLTADLEAHRGLYALDGDDGRGNRPSSNGSRAETREKDLRLEI